MNTFDKYFSNEVRSMRKIFLRMFSFGVMSGLMALCGSAWASDAAQKTELISPAGIVAVKQVDAVPHDGSLEGKRIVLRWNGKPNGDVFLDRVAELLEAKYKTATVVRAYRENPKTGIGAKEDIIVGGSEGQTKMIMAMKPDIVIASQAD